MFVSFGDQLNDMKQQLSEEQIKLIVLVAKLQEYNPTIGRYEAIVKSEINYEIQLSNGSIEIENHLIQDFIAGHDFNMQARLKAVAERFKLKEEYAVGWVKSKFKSTNLLILLSLLAIIVLFVLMIVQLVYLFQPF